MKKFLSTCFFRRSVQSVFGFIGLLGFFSSKNIIEQVEAKNVFDDKLSKHRLDNTVDSTTIANIVKFYWGPSNEITQDDYDKIHETFGKIPSEEEIEVLMSKAIQNMNTTRGTSLDSDGAASFQQ
jgi:hypothetical protein